MHNRDKTMTIRPIIESDYETCRLMVLDTIRRVNIRDYSQEQCAAWAGRLSDPENWKERSSTKSGLCVELNGALAGFADLTETGHLDMFFVHADHQGLGIARQLMTALKEMAVRNGHKTVTSDVSLTARPFFEKCQFIVLAAQEVQIGAETLKNFRMECLLSAAATK